MQEETALAEPPEVKVPEVVARGCDIREKIVVLQSGFDHVCYE
jgi:hypothetical protein